MKSQNNPRDSHDLERKSTMAVLQFREALNQAMCEEMDRDPDVF